MALIACHECSHQVSTEAKNCPSCGAVVRPPRKKTSTFTWIVVGLFTVGFGSSLLGLGRPSSNATPAAAAQPAAAASAPKKPTADDLRLQTAAAGALMLKKSAKDPEAFQLRSLRVFKDGAACYEYRAKNSFGAVLPGEAVMPSSGKMLVHESAGNTFVNAWNKLCTRPGGEDIAPMVARLGILD